MTHPLPHRVIQTRSNQWSIAAELNEATTTPPASTLPPSIHPKSILAKFPLLAEEYVTRNKAPVENVAFDSPRLCVWWCSVCQHQWKQSPLERCVMKAPCPQCAKAADPTIASCSLAKEIDTSRNDPTMNTKNLTIRDRRKIWWRCRECHGSYQTSVVARFSKKLVHEDDHVPKADSPDVFIIHDRQKKIKTVWSLKSRCCPHCEDMAKQELSKETLEEFHPSRNGDWTGESYFANHRQDHGRGKDAAVWWICGKCATEWQARFSHRLRGTQSCPNCGADAVQNEQIRKKHGDQYLQRLVKQQAEGRERTRLDLELQESREERRRQVLQQVLGGKDDVDDGIW